MIKDEETSNYFKGGLDALTAVQVIEDDSQIVRIEADKCDCQD